MRNSTSGVSIASSIAVILLLAGYATKTNNLPKTSACLLIGAVISLAVVIFFLFRKRLPVVEGIEESLETSSAGPSPLYDERNEIDWDPQH